MVRPGPSPSPEVSQFAGDVSPNLSELELYEMGVIVKIKEQF